MGFYVRPLPGVRVRLGRRGRRWSIRWKSGTANDYLTAALEGVILSHRSTIFKGGMFRCRL